MPSSWVFPPSFFDFRLAGADIIKGGAFRGAAFYQLLRAVRSVICQNTGNAPQSHGLGHEGARGAQGFASLRLHPPRLLCVLMHESIHISRPFVNRIT